MAKKGGFGGGMPGGMNMNNLLKQAQKMQADMQKAQEELEAKELEASVGGGAVVVKVNGKKEVVAINIKPEVVDPDAVNQAMREIDELQKSQMGKLTGGMNLPF